MSRKVDGHQARKRFGQNFLHDPGVIQRIGRCINPRPGDFMVEIGPGMGALTEDLLAGTEGHLHVVELDRDLIPGLKVKFFNHAGFHIHEADALKFDFRSLPRGEKPLRIVGNLPYNISTPLIFHLLSYAGMVKDMHFMLQKEVVDRLAAQPGDKEYGRLGIMAQYYCEVQHMFNVGPGAFKPAPKVDSAIVRLVPHASPKYPTKDIRTLENVVRTSFSQRRKTLRNNLKQIFDDVEILSSIGIDLQARPETLGLPEFVKIADFLFELQQQANNNG